VAEEVEVAATAARGRLDPGGARPVVVPRVDDRREEVGVQDEQLPGADEARVLRAELTAGDRLHVGGVERCLPRLRVRAGELGTSRTRTAGQVGGERRLPGALRAGDDDAQRPHVASVATAGRSPSAASERRHSTRPRAQRPRKIA